MRMSLNVKKAEVFRIGIYSKIGLEEYQNILNNSEIISGEKSLEARQLVSAKKSIKTRD